jgi:hypothetical protein
VTKTAFTTTNHYLPTYNDPDSTPLIPLTTAVSGIEVLPAIHTAENKKARNAPLTPALCVGANSPWSRIPLPTSCSRPFGG